MARPRAHVVPEREVQAGCLEALAMFGIDAGRQNTGVGTYSNADGSTRLVRYGRPGDPDISGTLPDGRRLDLECKRVGKRPTAKQLDRLMRTNAGGGVGLWVDDPAELAKVLPKLLAGGRIEVEPDGRQWIVTDEPEAVQGGGAS
jgi:hypothetical protein